MAGLLVTGSGGFIGRALVDRLQLTEKPVWEIQHRRDCDMRDREAVRDRIARAQPDIIVHLVASPDQGETGTAVDWNTVGATLNLVRAARATKVVPNIVHVGSYKQYGSAALPFTESAEMLPTSKYGQNKQLSERILRQAERFGYCTVTALRLGPVFGPGQSPLALIPRLIECLAGNGDPLTVGTKPWDPLYLDDAIDALVTVLGQDTHVGETFNVSGGVATTPLEVAGLIGTELGLPSGDLDTRLRVASDLGWSCHGDITRMKALTGWHPRTSHAAAIGRMVGAVIG